MRLSLIALHRCLSMCDKIGPVPAAPMPTRTELPLLSECCSPVVREVIQLAEAETLAEGSRRSAIQADFGSSHWSQPTRTQRRVSVS